MTSPRWARRGPLLAVRGFRLCQKDAHSSLLSESSVMLPLVLSCWASTPWLDLAEAAAGGRTMAYVLNVSTSSGPAVGPGAPRKLTVPRVATAITARRPPMGRTEDARQVKRTRTARVPHPRALPGAGRGPKVRTRRMVRRQAFGAALDRPRAARAPAP